MKKISDPFVRFDAPKPEYTARVIYTLTHKIDQIPFWAIKDIYQTLYPYMGQDEPQK